MKINRSKATCYFYLIICLFVIFFFSYSCKNVHQPIYKEYSGEGIGTFYQIILRDSTTREFQRSIDSILTRMNDLFSLFSKESTIIQFNNSDKGVVDHDFAVLTQEAMRIAQLTNGTFDPTVAPLVRLWGFGPDSPHYPDSTEVTVLLKSIGMHHIRVVADSVIKDLSTISLDYNGIAKGFTVDRVADYLEQEGISHYMVNIGGEIRAKGLSPRGKDWVLGIETPQDNLLPGSSILQRLYLSSKAIATSGNYRSFREGGGKKWGHTINPKTGYPEANTLLSATVLAETCTEADALATSTMVAGLEAAKKFFEQHSEYGAILILRHDSLTFELWTSEGMNKLLLDANR